MKTIQNTFKLIITFCFILTVSANLFAQNETFSFQGIARDTEGKAISNSTIDVKFSIFPDGDPASPWLETQSLSTDGFGVFSTSIGMVASTSFNNIDFSDNIYRLKVEILIGASYVEVSNEILKSVPYARSAANGVPAGCIMPYAGSYDNIPEGWALCDGSSYDPAQYPALAAAIGSMWGSNLLPDLRDKFLRGAVPSSRVAGNYQADDNKTHDHNTNAFSDTFDLNSGTAVSNGNHIHRTVRNSDQGSDDGYGADNDNLIAKIRNDGTSEYDYIMWFCDNTSKTPIGGTTSDGAHDHTVTGTVNVNVPLSTSTSSGGSESRPRNYAVNYIIKL